MTLPQPPQQKRIIHNHNEFLAAAAAQRISFEDAICELVDNALDARAQNVSIHMVSDGGRLARLVVVDDGCGMNSDDLNVAMMWPARFEVVAGRIGTDGHGLKSASFEQCNRFAVISRKDDSLTGRLMSRELLMDEGRVGIYEAGQCEEILKLDKLPFGESGTVIVWDEPRLNVDIRGGFDAGFRNARETLISRLGLVFHRFLEDGSLSLKVVTMPRGAAGNAITCKVSPLNPVGYHVTGYEGFPVDFHARVHGKTSTVNAHIWPTHNNSANFFLGGRDGVRNQGFYTYWRNRLIDRFGFLAGHGAQGRAERLTQRARCVVDLPEPATSSGAYANRRIMIESFRHELCGQLQELRSGTTSFEDYLDCARYAFRNANAVIRNYQTVLVPGNGMPMPLRTYYRQHQAETENARDRQVCFEWAAFEEPDHDRLFLVDRETDLISLNRRYRNIITNGANGGADAPLFKMMLFELLKEAFEAQRMGANIQARLEWLDQILSRTIQRLEG